MKLSYGDLRKIINEVAISPSVFKNNQPVSDPFDKPNVAKAMAAIQEPFKRAVEANMILGARDKYNEETREFDDATYKQIQEVAGKASEKLVALVHKAVQQTWQEAMSAVGGQSGEQPVQKPAQKKVA